MGFDFFPTFPSLLSQLSLTYRSDKVKRVRFLVSYGCIFIEMLNVKVLNAINPRAFTLRYYDISTKFIIL